MKIPALFRQKAPKIGRDLMKDLSLSKEDASAILGNLGHECLGFTKLQEMAPTVKGSKGGYGWPQWTGPRRRAYEAWCKQQNLDPASDEANYGYLLVELRGPEKAALPKLKAAVGLRNKVIAFENGFERAGAKKYDSRLAYAEAALALLGGAVASTTKPGTVSKEVIEAVQGLLRDKGFPEVGDVDGKFGPRTQTAIESFQSYVGVAKTGQIDDGLIAQLVRYPGRPQAPSRVNATAKDLKEQPTVDAADKLKKTGGALIGIGGIGGLIDAIDFDSWSAKAEKFRSLSETVLSFSPWIIGIAVGAAAIWLGSKIIRDQVAAYREGRSL